MQHRPGITTLLPIIWIILPKKFFYSCNKRHNAIFILCTEGTRMRKINGTKNIDSFKTKVLIVVLRDSKLLNKM